jgi:hypothetical protein
MGNQKQTKGQRMIYRTLDRKLKIEQEVNAQEERTFPAQSKFSLIRNIMEVLTSQYITMKSTVNHANKGRLA